MLLLFYGFTLWLGSYLLSRSSNKVTVWLTGWGLIAYALALATQLLQPQFFPILLLAPALLWMGAAVHLIPEAHPARPAILRIWAVTAIPLAILTQLNGWFAVLIISGLILCAVVIARLALHARLKNTFALLAVLALFVTLSTGLLILPLNWLPLSWGLALLGSDLILLGLTITAWDAFEEGQAIRGHLMRSFVAALYYSGALTLLAILFSRDERLLMVLVTFGILTQTFSSSIQALLDKLTLSQHTTDERQSLRQTAEALPLLAALGPVEADEEQFTRLTRRALSHLSDLPKLAANPLINLPQVASTASTNALDRAHALKSLLVQSIQKLKPRSEAEFGATDEWRYYNSVYFPYVLGLKPYTRRVDHESLDEASRAALDWFQSSVPERTLHNWQNAAAKLIAEDLRRAHL
jgi:hypothetical protein